MAVTLTSKRHQVSDDAEAMEFCFQRAGPTGCRSSPPRGRVRACWRRRGSAPEQVAFITNRAVSVTAEKVAINAVMAGCKPEYMPVVVAAVEGIGDPAGAITGRGPPPAALPF